MSVNAKQEAAKNNGKKKKKQVLVYKPYEKGAWKGKHAARRGIKVFLYYLVVAFLYIILGASLQFDSVFLRWASNLLLVAACAGVYYMEGAHQGNADVALGEIVLERKNSGKPISPDDQENCYHPLKGLFTFLVGSALLLLVTLVFAVIAQKQVYQLQGLPSWVAGYQGHDEVALPLDYYNHTAGVTLEDILRIIVRVLVFPFANIATADDHDVLLLVDRLSPILACLPGLGYVFGYLTGPRSRAMVHGDIASNNRRHARRQRKAAQERREAAARRAAEKRRLV